MRRRKFLQKSTLGAAALLTTPPVLMNGKAQAAGNASNGWVPAAGPASNGWVPAAGPALGGSGNSGHPDGLFIGTPVLPEVLYERGIAQTLDAMKEMASGTRGMADKNLS